MNVAFERFQRQLGRVTFGVLLAGLAFFALAILSALLGFSQVAESFGAVAASIAYVFGALFPAFLLTALAGAVVRWLDRRSHIKNSNG